MRTCMVTVLVLAFAASSFAQGFIPKAEQDARKRELSAYAQRILDAKDSRERGPLVKDMLDKDAIRDANGKVVGDGFSVEAFSWLYKQGLQTEDADARLFAVIALGSLGSSSSAQDVLIDALNSDPSDAVQLRALQSIERSGIQRAQRNVVLKLRSANVEVAAAAARCLAALGADPQNQATGPMIDLLAQTYQRLAASPSDDPSRVDYQRLIEVLGQSCAKLIPSITWAPGQGMDDIGREIAKFTAWWNAKSLAALKDPRFETRRDALSRISRTADRSAFGPVLDAASKEVDRLRAAGSFSERSLATQFVIDAGAVLDRVSGLNQALRLGSSPDDMAAAVKAWQAWFAKNP